MEEQILVTIGQELLPAKRVSSKSKETRYQNYRACKNCFEKDKCIPGKYRTVYRREFDDVADEVDERTRNNYEIFRKRKQLAEHPFGTIKRSLGFTYFLTKGKENVLNETFMHFLAYNMKRVINIIGVKELEEQLQG